MNGRSMMLAWALVLAIPITTAGGAIGEEDPFASDEDPFDDGEDPFAAYESQLSNTTNATNELAQDDAEESEEGASADDGADDGEDEQAADRDRGSSREEASNDAPGLGVLATAAVGTLSAIILARERR